MEDNPGGNPTDSIPLPPPVGICPIPGKGLVRVGLGPIVGLPSSPGIASRWPGKRPLWVPTPCGFLASLGSLGSAFCGVPGSSLNPEVCLPPLAGTAMPPPPPGGRAGSCGSGPPRREVRAVIAVPAFLSNIPAFAVASPAALVVSVRARVCARATISACWTAVLACASSLFASANTFSWAVRASRYTSATAVKYVAAALYTSAMRP
ncbi:hypothetical protein LAUMK4_05900 [Mycobacterium persicum]|uniref:Uncharacterized protein n=1 Tax=Mycobacterium persicum TaxID=1487726 RepID=A0ABY6RSP0_9MYCO|nr:hypothetical protein LAUMK4_05900 [Mycobacterium persicum]